MNALVRPTCIAAALLLAACEPLLLSAHEWSLLDALRATEAPPPDPTNRFLDDERVVSLGRILYHDPRFSGPLAIGTDSESAALGAVGETHKVRCTSCHTHATGAADARRSLPMSLGAGFTPRHTPSVFYTGENGAFFSWDGHRDSAWNQSLVPMESGAAHNTSRLYVVRMVIENYGDEFFDAFPDVVSEDDRPSRDVVAEWNEPKDETGALRCPPRTSGPSCFCTDPDDVAAGVACAPPSATVRGRVGSWEWAALDEDEQRTCNTIYAHFAKALHAYMRQLRPYSSPFDRFMAGDDEALSPDALRGAQLFVGKASCNECHRGPTFTDGSFHNIGVPQTVALAMPNDDGRAEGLRRLLTSGVATFSACGDFSDERREIDDEGALTACGARVVGQKACVTDDDCLEAFVPCAREDLVVPGVCGQRRGTCFTENSPEGTDGVCIAPTDVGAFKVPTLRNVAVSAPYMHNGAIATLWDVVDFYNGANGTDGFPGERDVAIAPLGLEPDEVNDLVAFLAALTDDLGAVDDDVARWLAPPTEEERGW